MSHFQGLALVLTVGCMFCRHTRCKEGCCTATQRRGDGGAVLALAALQESLLFGDNLLHRCQKFVEYFLSSLFKHSAIGGEQKP